MCALAVVGQSPAGHTEENLPWGRTTSPTIVEPPSAAQPRGDTGAPVQLDRRYGNDQPRLERQPVDPNVRPQYTRPETARPDYARPEYRQPEYAPPPAYSPPEYAPPAAPEPAPEAGYSSNEILEAGHRFFGTVSSSLAKVVEYAFQRAGRPNGYILGEEAGGAFIAGLRYGEGTLYTKNAGQRQVYWQGPSIGYDMGAEGSKTMVLVYDLHGIDDIYRRFSGIDGSAYFIGGVGVTFLKMDHVTLAPIRSGVGIRLGANVGYLKYTRQPTWNPF